jgi:hypothetical protein
VPPERWEDFHRHESEGVKDKVNNDKTSIEYRPGLPQGSLVVTRLVAMCG